MKIWIIWLWTVWSWVARWLLEDNNHFSSLAWKQLQLVSVFTLNPKSPKSVWLFESNPWLFVKNIDDIINNPEIDIIVETVWGVEIAKSIIVNAITRWKHVVTANKDLIATHGHSLFKLAKEKWVSLKFEASVAWAIPVISVLQTWMVWNKLKWFMWIMNWTCNYILTKMQDNPKLSFIEVLDQAKSLWYAESDPTNDIEWYDTYYKLSILSYLAFGRFLSKDELDLKWITQIMAIDFVYLAKIWATVKLLWYIEQLDDLSLNAFVWPVVLRKQHKLANIDWVINAILLHGKWADIVVSWPWAWWDATATAIISDIINIVRWVIVDNIKSDQNIQITDLDKPIYSYYCRFTVSDRLWIIHEISWILFKYNINIREILQHDDIEDEEKNLYFVMTLDNVGQWAVRMAIQEIDLLDFIKKPTYFMRMFD